MVNHQSHSATDELTALANLANAIGGELNVRMVPGARWEYNHDKRQLIYNVAAMSGLTFQQAKGLVFKNLGHCLYSQTDLSPRAISQDIAKSINRKLGAKSIHPESIKMLMRATEDERSEYRLRTKRYPGLKNGDLPRWDQGYRREWFLKKYEELQRVSPQGAIDKDGNSLYYLRAQTMVRGLVSGALTHDDLPEDMPWSEALCERIAALRKEPTVNGALRKWAALAPLIAEARPVEDFVPPTGCTPTPEDGEGEGEGEQQSPDYAIESDEPPSGGGSGGAKPDENTQGWGDTEEGAENDKREREDKPEPNGADESDEQDDDDTQDNDDQGGDANDKQQDSDDKGDEQEQDDENFADGSGEGLDQPQEPDDSGGDDDSEESDESGEDDDEDFDDTDGDAGDDDEYDDEEDESDEGEGESEDDDGEGTDGDPYQGNGAGDEAVDEDDADGEGDDEEDATPKDELEEIRDKAKQEPKQQAQGDVKDETEAQRGSTGDGFLGGGAGLGTSELNTTEYEYTPSWSQVVSTIQPYVSPIRKSIERYLKENEIVDKVHGYRSGKFDVKSAMNAQRNGNDHAYSRRADKGQRSFAVHILVDTSSSMSAAVAGTDSYPEIFDKQKLILHIGRRIQEVQARIDDMTAKRQGARIVRETASSIKQLENLKREEQSYFDGSLGTGGRRGGSRILMATRMCVAIAEAFRSFQDVQVGYSGFATPYTCLPGKDYGGPALSNLRGRPNRSGWISV
jgi:hypothetical protein